MKTIVFSTLFACVGCMHFFATGESDTLGEPLGQRVKLPLGLVNSPISMRGDLRVELGKESRYRLECPGMEVEIQFPSDNIDFDHLEGATLHVRGYLRNYTNSASTSQGQAGSPPLFAHTRCFIDVQEYEIIEEKKQRLNDG